MLTGRQTELLSRLSAEVNFNERAEIRYHPSKKTAYGRERFLSHLIAS
jgi:hypothetical protein